MPKASSKSVQYSRGSQIYGTVESTNAKTRSESRFFVFEVLSLKVIESRLTTKSREISGVILIEKSAGANLEAS